MYGTVLHFWFEELTPPMWWKVTPGLDEEIRRRFGALLEQAASGGLYGWRRSHYGRLAEIIVLDQFSRNVYRHTPAAFAQDSMALGLAQEALSAGALRVLNPVECGFLLMPFMHSESSRIHTWAEALFRDHATQQALQAELKHKAIIDRFGRYPIETWFWAGSLARKSHRCLLRDGSRVGHGWLLRPRSAQA